MLLPQDVKRAAAVGGRRIAFDNEQIKQLKMFGEASLRYTLYSIFTQYTIHPNCTRTCTNLLFSIIEEYSYSVHRINISCVSGCFALTILLMHILKLYITRMYIKLLYCQMTFDKS